MADLSLRACWSTLAGVTVLAIATTVQAADWRYSGNATESNMAPTPVAEAPAQSGMALPPPAPRAPGMVMPPSGIKLEKVRSQFGPPQQEIPAVGDPPILRWKYPEYIVYFEYDLVIISVPIDI